MNRIRPQVAAMAGFFFLVMAARGAEKDLEVAPRRGTVQTRQVVSLAVSAPSTGKETKRVVYTPPPGWYVRSHRLTFTRKEGMTSYAVATVPSAWSSVTEETTAETEKTKGEAEAGATVWKSAGARGSWSKENWKTEKRSQSYSHHALVVEAAAQGGGFLRGGANLELVVTAELVYVGRD